MAPKPGFSDDGEKSRVPDHANSAADVDAIKERSERFTNWCQQVGIRFPKMGYPHFFENGLVGAVVTQPIDYRESFLYVPFTAMISVDKCLRDPAMFEFYEQNPQLFSKEHQDWEQLILACFLVRQKHLGEESFWAPYIESMPDVHFFCEEPADVVLATMDPQLIIGAVEYRDELSEEWETIKPVLQKHVNLFGEELIERRQFLSFYAQVCTRCFGYGLPFTAMIPMADTLNHSDVNTTNEVVSRSLHLSADEECAYFTKTKFMNDYSGGPIFADTDEKSPLDYLNIHGRLDRELYKQNQFLYSVEAFAEHAATKQLWEVPFAKLDFEEDNDTSDEDAESDDEGEEAHNARDVKARAALAKILGRDDKDSLFTIQTKGPLHYLVEEEKRILAKRAQLAADGEKEPIDEL